MSPGRYSARSRSYPIRSIPGQLPGAGNSVGGPAWRRQPPGTRGHRPCRRGRRKSCLNRAGIELLQQPPAAEVLMVDHDVGCRPVEGRRDERMAPSKWRTGRPSRQAKASVMSVAGRGVT